MTTRCYDCGGETGVSSRPQGLPPRCTRCVELARLHGPDPHRVVLCEGCRSWKTPGVACAVCLAVLTQRGAGRRDTPLIPPPPPPRDCWRCTAPIASTIFTRCTNCGAELSAERRAA